tara:strand:+ start:354 stop:866 length:513 start_codon:yes stop_codon:yes gene_type:complete
MTKILSIILLSFFIFNFAHASKKTTYLKCPMMMKENRGETFPDSWWPIGSQLNEFFVKIVEGKKDKITINKYFTGKNFRKDSKPKHWDYLKNIVPERNGNILKYSVSNSYKLNGEDHKESETFIFTKDSAWKSEYLEFAVLPSVPMHTKHKLVGDCSELDKKTYKKLIKG